MLFSSAFDVKTELCHDLDFFNSHQGPKLNYSNQKVEGCLQLIPHAVLFEYGVKDYDIEMHAHPVFRKIFFRTGGGELPFDLFGAAFWLLSRYEEYLPHKTDKFNRFHYKTSVAYQHDFLEIPLVNLWQFELKKILEKKFPELKFKPRSYNFISTIDVDNAFLYKDKGAVRVMAGYISDLLHRNFSGMKQRTLILLNKKEDPFDCYDFLIQSNKEMKIASIYFFLLGDYGVNDKNIAASNRHFQALIKHISDYSQIGIHPSFGSGDKIQQLLIEINRLASITHKQVKESRQHFSILKFPYTYNALLQAGITDDYSMGYTNRNGFRTSYCHPFKWYNILEESVSSLTLHPFVFTENTLEYDAGLNKSNFIEQTLPFIEEVKKYGGELISIFHNNSFNERMRTNYMNFIEKAR